MQTSEEAAQANAEQAMSNAASEFERAMEALDRAIVAAAEADMAAAVRSTREPHNWTTVHHWLTIARGELRPFMPRGFRMTQEGFAVTDNA